MQSLGNPGNTYGHCHASEDAPAISARRHKCGAARLCGGSNSLAASYVAVAMFGLGAFMINAAYWVLSSLTTSFNAQLGSFSLAALYIAFIVSLLLVPSLVAILGSKTCSVLSGLCTLVFTASYFYPSWYTIVPSSVLQGFAYGLMYTTISVTKNDEVRRVVEKLKVDEITYQGRFTAVIIFACNSAGVVAGFISVATLSGGNDHTSSSCTYLFDNITHNTSGQTGVTVTLSTAAATAADTSTNYYILVAVCTALAFLSVVTFSITRAAAYHQCRVHSFGLREALRKAAKHTADVFKQAITPAYAPVLPLRILQGLVGAYFFGVFTKVSYDVHAHTHTHAQTHCIHFNCRCTSLSVSVLDLWVYLSLCGVCSVALEVSALAGLCDTRPVMLLWRSPSGWDRWELLSSLLRGCVSQALQQLLLYQPYVDYAMESIVLQHWVS